MENHGKIRRRFTQDVFSSPWVFLFIIILLALFIRFIVIFMYGGDSYGGDAAIYKWRADNLLEGKVPYRDFYDVKPPMLTLTIASWFLITSNSSLLSIKIFFSLFDIICIVTGYLFLRERTQNTLSPLIFTLMIAFNPIIFFDSAYYGRHYIIPATLLIISLSALKKGQEIKSAITMGISIMYTYLSVLFLLAFILHIKGKKPLAKYIIITIITVLIILFPYLYLAGGKYIDDTVYFFSEKIERGFSIWVVVNEVSNDIPLKNTLPFIIQAIFLTIITTFFMVSSKFSLRERKTFSFELFILTFYLTFLLLNKHILLQYFVILTVFLPLFISLLKTGKKSLIIHMITFYVASWAIFLVYRMEYEYFKKLPQFTLGVALIYLAALIPLIFLSFSIERISSDPLNKAGSSEIAK